MAEAAAVLKEYSAALKPFKATGNCLLSYTNEKKEVFSLSFPVRVWFDNPAKFCIYGDVMFDSKGVCFAVDGDKYWTYAKPYGVYITGKNETDNFKIEDNFFSSRVLLDFIEPFGWGCGEIVMENSKDNRNVMTCSGEDGCKWKKISIDRCDRLIRKIEYLNCTKEPVLVVELDEYKNISGGKDILFPYKLIYKHIEKRNSMQIKLDSVKLWEASDQQLKALFAGPDANDFKKEAK
jgi:hypothetical protein